MATFIGIGPAGKMIGWYEGSTTLLHRELDEEWLYVCTVG